MAPEQAMAKSSEIDAQTDLWARVRQGTAMPDLDNELNRRAWLADAKTWLDAEMWEHAATKATISARLARVTMVAVGGLTDCGEGHGGGAQDAEHVRRGGGLSGLLRSHRSSQR